MEDVDTNVLSVVVVDGEALIAGVSWTALTELDGLGPLLLDLSSERRAGAIGLENLRTEGGGILKLGSWTVNLLCSDCAWLPFQGGVGTSADVASKAWEVDRPDGLRVWGGSQEAEEEAEVMALKLLPSKTVSFSMLSAGIVDIVATDRASVKNVLSGSKIPLL